MAPVVSRGFRGRRAADVDPARTSPGQYVTADFPVLSAGPTPHTALDLWDFSIVGELAEPRGWTWEEFRALPSEEITRDIHCVTKWTKLDTVWRGVSVDTLLEGVETSAAYVMAYSDGGYTTNLPLEDVTGGKAWVVFAYAGQPLAPEHGGPARMLVPQHYFWKSAKWVRRLSHDWWRWFVKVVSRSACLPVSGSLSWENRFMAYNFAGGGDGDQVFLMPPDPRDWLPEGHLAWAMRRAAGGLDLAPFLSAYRADGQGNTAYHPRMMVALIMYCYAKGVRSSRAVEMATFDDVGARVICGGLHPDHATCARFVTRHKEPLKGLLVQSLAACAREGLVRVDITAGDGTKVKANASMAANATAEQLGLDITGLERLLEAEVEAWIEQARAGDAAEDALFGGDDGPPPGAGPGGRKRTAGKLACRQAAQAKLEADQRVRRQQAGAERAERIAKLAAEKDRLEARAAEELAKGRAKVARYAAPDLDLGMESGIVVVSSAHFPAYP